MVFGSFTQSIIVFVCVYVCVCVVKFVLFIRDLEATATAVLVSEEDLHFNHKD